MKRLTFLITVLTPMFLFSGCGQSGPLYVAGNPSQMAVPPSQPSASTDEKDEESSDSSAVE